MTMTPPALTRHTFRVYWEDTDAGGVVYHANYLKFFERARTEWLRSLGIEQQRMREETHALFMLAGIQLKYVAPARLDDVITVTVHANEQGTASMVLSQQAWCGDTLLAEAQVRVGCVHADTLRPRRIPPDIQARLQAT